MSLHLHGLGHFHPENEITNRFLEELDIGTSDEWIRERVGIRSRRTRCRRPASAPPATATCAPHARRRCGAPRSSAPCVCKRLSDVVQLLTPNAVVVIGGQSMPDYTTPAEACNVARELGLDVPAFDVNSACTSLLLQIHVLSMMRPEALPPYVLVVSPECATKTVDYTDRATAVLWGDGAAAAVLSCREPGRARVLGSFTASDPSGAGRVVVPFAGHFAQDGRVVQMFAVKKSAESFTRLRDEFAAPERTLHFVGHQANLRMLESVCARCAIPPERHHRTSVVRHRRQLGVGPVDALGALARRRRHRGGRRRRRPTGRDIWCPGAEGPHRARQRRRPLALVTGAGSGIGGLRAGAGRGGSVVLHYRSSAAPPTPSPRSWPAFVLQADASAVEALVGAVAERAGRVDVLVNNAGANVNAPLATMKLEDYDAVTGLLRGTWYLTKLVLRRFMLRQGSGRIVNISSVVGHTGNGGQTPYTMAKAGLDALTKSMAQELAGRAILVNWVAPGFIDTEMTAGLPAERRAEILARVPLGRLGSAAEVRRYGRLAGDLRALRARHGDPRERRALWRPRP